MPAKLMKCRNNLQHNLHNYNGIFIQAEGRQATRCSARLRRIQHSLYWNTDVMKVCDSKQLYHNHHSWVIGVLILTFYWLTWITKLLQYRKRTLINIIYHFLLSHSYVVYNIGNVNLQQLFQCNHFGYWCRERSRLTMLGY